MDRQGRPKIPMKQSSRGEAKYESIHKKSFSPIPSPFRLCTVLACQTWHRNPDNILLEIQRQRRPIDPLKDRCCFEWVVAPNRGGPKASTWHDRTNKTKHRGVKEIGKLLLNISQVNLFKFRPLVRVGKKWPPHPIGKGASNLTFY